MVSLRFITVEGGASYIEVSCLSYNGRVRVKENFTKTFLLLRFGVFQYITMPVPGPSSKHIVLLAVFV